MTDHTSQAAVPSPVPYGTPEVPRVAVRGESHLEADPETAGIQIAVTARGTSRRTALDDLTGRNTAVLDLVRTYQDAVESLETGAFSIRPELRHGRGERVRSYQGYVRVSAVLTDFTALGELVTRLGDLDFTQVHGPSWALRPSSPVYRQARQQAVREAVQRAREYAEALGTSLAALVELADADAEQPVPFGAPSPRFAGFGGAARTPEPEPLDLEPQRQHVRAHITARFTMLPPRL
jgi:uncharacterized protein YggE